jgi:Ca2+-binding EF-hand superfamily protein
MDWLYKMIFPEEANYDIPAEELEELRMMSNLEVNEIKRLKKYYVEELTGGKDDARLGKDQFLDIPCVANNPLKERLVVCFGFSARNNHSLDFPSFLLALSKFNAVRKKEEKLRLAFQIQDFDDDNQLSRDDVKKYLQCVTDNNGILSDEQLEDTVTEIFRETSSSIKQTEITFADFCRVMAPTDFHTKLYLPIGHK